IVEKLADQGSGEVVRDVAGDDLVALGKCGADVEPEDVRAHDLDVVVTGERLSQRWYQPAVELDRHQPARSGSEGDGERSHACANLEHLVVGCDVRGFGNGVAHGR